MIEMSLESLDEQGEEELRRNSKNYAFSTLNLSYIQYKDYDLNLIQKDKPLNDLPKIPASLLQRLTYFRCFSCSPLKQQMFFTQPTCFLSHVWGHIYRNIFESMPHLYTIIFLSLYTPHEHFYASKMVPLLSGVSLQIVMSSFFVLVIHADNLTLLLDYALLGVVSRTPWNRCENINDGNDFCYDFQDFYAMIKQNATSELLKTKVIYKLNGTFFRPSQIKYLDFRNNLRISQKLNVFLIYYGIIWITAVMFYRQIFKKYVWELYTWTFWIICFIYAVSLLYIEIFFYSRHIPYISPELLHYTQEFRMKFDFERYCELFTAPPIVHFIHARSNSEVKPGPASTLISISTMLFYIFQGIVYLRLKNYCDVKAGISLQVDKFNSFPLFYEWPIFFTTFPLGPLFTKLFFSILFCVEYLTFVITYQCMIETVTSEWKKYKWWIVSILVTVAALIYKLLINDPGRKFMFVFALGTTALAERVIIYWFYPVGRLIEDINFFYYGNFVTRIRRVTLEIMPILFLIGMSVSFNTLLLEDYTYYSIIIAVIPIFLGLIYRLRWIYVNKLPCKTLFIPLKTWGPQDYVTKMYRKQFNQHKFIDSVAERFLSRYMLKKAEPPSYQLGLHYSHFQKRSTIYN